MNENTTARAEDPAARVTSPEEVDLLSPAQVKCPWHAYEVLREQAPVWQDPRTGHYIVSRYEDIRTVLLDPDRYTAFLKEGDDTHRPEIRALYEEKGMLPATSMLGLDDPEHRYVRGVMDKAFRPKRVMEMDARLEELCSRIMDRFIDRGEVDIHSEYGAEIALRTMTMIMGVPEEDGPMIQGWTENWLERISMLMTPDQEVESAEMEVRAQNYFQAIIDRVREQPEDNLISDIVNGVVPEWGEGLSNSQIQIEILVDMFTGGVGTTSHAISTMIRTLIERPDLWEKVRSDPDRYLETFIEEVIRTDGPQQGDPRLVAEDSEIAGVKIPKGAIVHPRWGAGNRDPRRFGEQAGAIDLERTQSRTHLGFGVGTHHCIGRPLARRELYHAVKQVIDRIDRMWFLETPDQYVENYIVRGLTSLRIGFERKQ